MDAEADQGTFRQCWNSIYQWLSICASCGRHRRYSQAFLDEDNAHSASASATASPYRAPPQATSSSMTSPTTERAGLLSKATELHSTGPGRPGNAKPGKSGKWGQHEEQMTSMNDPKKDMKNALSIRGKNQSGLSLAASEEGETCSTCLEVYTPENPAIWTKCNHHFHLACIYEWMERKQTCPICERQMSFSEIGC